MPFKNPFGKKSPPKVQEPVRRISVEPVQSQADQEASRARMEQELTNSKAARDAKKSEPAQE